MAVLADLDPKEVFRWFEALSAIPRGSGHTEAVSAWCADLARERGLEVHQDPAGNVVIAAPASPGYEGAAGLILQGHLDMVCEKDADASIDMEREGLRLIVEDGDLIRAEGTTLGADDGIAVAMALAVLDDPSIPHPPLEVLLTTDEEIGMLGAAALDPSPIRGRQLLNLDSEEEGVFTVSCAGGCVVSRTIPVRRETVRGEGLRIVVWGLTGGHSGTEIHHGRANADILLGRILRGLADQVPLRLSRAQGGTKDNAIPVRAEAEVVVESADRAMHVCFDVVSRLREAYAATDPCMAVDVLPVPVPDAMDALSTERALRLLTEVPDGVQALSAEIPGLVQTSLNLGILRTGEDHVTAASSVRSSIEAEKTELVERLSRLTEELGGSVSVTGDYPGWAYRTDSPLRDRCAVAFRDLYGHPPKIEAVHAGLECGILCGKLPGLDCVSLGPEISEIHTPRERMRAASVRRTWDLLREILARSR